MNKRNASKKKGYSGYYYLLRITQDRIRSTAKSFILWIKSPMVLADVFEVYYSNVYYSKVGGVKVRSFIDLFMTSRTVSEIQSG